MLGYQDCHVIIMIMALRLNYCFFDEPCQSEYGTAEHNKKLA